MSLSKWIALQVSSRICEGEGVVVAPKYLITRDLCKMPAVKVQQAFRVSDCR